MFSEFRMRDWREFDHFSDPLYMFTHSINGLKCPAQSSNVLVLLKIENVART